MEWLRTGRFIGDSTKLTVYTREDLPGTEIWKEKMRAEYENGKPGFMYYTEYAVMHEGRLVKKLWRLSEAKSYAESRAWLRKERWKWRN